MKWTIGLLLVLGFAGSCGSERSERTITIKGSDTMVILCQRWAETYMHHNPGMTVQVTGGGSGTGIAALINGGTDICAASRPMKDKEKEQIKTKHGKAVQETAVALDGLAIYLNEANPVAQLSLAQLDRSIAPRSPTGKMSAALPARSSAMGVRTIPALTLTSRNTY